MISLPPSDNRQGGSHGHAADEAGWGLSLGLISVVGFEEFSPETSRAPCFVWVGFNKMIPAFFGK